MSNQNQSAPKFVLVDYENVQPRNLRLLKGKPFKVVVFAGANQTKLSTDFVIDFLPVRKGQNTRTVYDNLDGTPQRLPEDWVRAGNTAGMTSLDENLRSFDVKWDRETFGLGAEYLFTPNLIVDADWRYQTKQGQGRTWGSFLGNAAELTLPLDYDTHEVDAGITYAGSVNKSKAYSF